MRPLARLLSKDFHVIIPVLDGHAESDRPFTTIRSNAEEIISSIDEELGGRTELIAGLSLGAQIALEMLSIRPGITKYAVIESANVVPSGIPEWLIRSSIELSWPLVRKKSFAGLQFRKLRLPLSSFDDYFRDTCAMTLCDAAAFITRSVKYETGPELAMTEAEVHVVYGGKEHAVVKKSAYGIRERLPSASVTEIPGLRHGEASIKLHYSYLEIIHGMLG